MNELQKIKEIIHKVAKEMNIEIDKIILFGSRARGDYREDSDYDLLIVTKEKLERERKKAFISQILRKWAKIRVENKIFDYDLDLIVISVEDFEKYKGTIGDVIGFASIEGVIL